MERDLFGPKTCNIITPQRIEWENKQQMFLFKWKTPYALWHVTKPYSDLLSQDHDIKLNFLFPTKYIIHKSLQVGHCLWHKTVQNVFLFPSCPFLSFPTAAQGPKFRKKVIQKGSMYLSYLGMSSNPKLGNEIEFRLKFPWKVSNLGVTRPPTLQICSWNLYIDGL